ncbi:MAG: hypothetical protein ACRDR6_10840 [Pseudonocardiaceae bacterium]
MSLRQRRTARRIARFWDEKYAAARTDEARAAVVWQHVRAILADNRTALDVAVWSVVNDRLDGLLTEVAALTEREVFGNKTFGSVASAGAQRADAPASA